MCITLPSGYAYGLEDWEIRTGVMTTRGLVCNWALIELILGLGEEKKLGLGGDLELGALFAVLVVLLTGNLAA